MVFELQYLCNFSFALHYYILILLKSVMFFNQLLYPSLGPSKPLRTLANTSSLKLESPGPWLIIDNTNSPDLSFKRLIVPWQRGHATASAGFSFALTRPRRLTAFSAQSDGSFIRATRAIQAQGRVGVGLSRSQITKQGLGKY
jgi:hypothetical protein